MLYILTFFLSGTRWTGPGSSYLTNIGILHITWLLGNDSRFAGIQKPDTQILRRSGMFEVDLNAMAREKTDRALDEGEINVSELTKLNRIDTITDTSCQEVDMAMTRSGHLGPY